MTRDNLVAKSRRGRRFYRACRKQNLLPWQVWPWTMTQLHLLRETHAKELLVAVRRTLQEIDPPSSHRFENVYEFGLRRGKMYRVRRSIGSGHDHLFFDVSGFALDKKEARAEELTVGEMKDLIALAGRLRRA